MGEIMTANDIDLPNFLKLLGFQIKSSLNCPYCPSQSYATKHAGDVERSLGHPDDDIDLYRCISGHIFFVKKEEDDNLSVL